jgi:hypothetical protein
VLIVSRPTWLVTGVVWAVRSILELAHPDYWNPVTTLDWLAVWLFSLCWLHLAPAAVLLGRASGARSATTVAAVIATGALAAGLANAIEDGMGIAAGGSVYVVGSLTAWFGLLALVLALGTAGRRRLAWVAGVIFVGFPFFNVGGGLVVGGAPGTRRVPG